MATDLQNKRIVRVPNVVGRTATKAQILLQDAGLPKIVTLYRESYEDRDTVLEQRPARGQMVYETTEVTIWIARRGYLENLPAIYRRSDATGRNLVRDVCFVFEHMFDSIEAKLIDGWRFYDPHAAPDDFLIWLASWTAFTIDLEWPEEQKRALMKRSVDLYRIRGTRRGLALFLQLFTGHEPDISENVWPFKGFLIEEESSPEGARIGLDSVILPPVNLAHCFIVTMPIRFESVSPEMVIRIHRIIQMEKPAHTHYYLRFAHTEGDAELREFFEIGMRSGIGIGAEIVQEATEGTTEVTLVAGTNPTPPAKPEGNQ